MYKNNCASQFHVISPISDAYSYIYTICARYGGFFATCPTGSGTKAFAPDVYNTPNQSQMKKLSNAAEMGDEFSRRLQKQSPPSFSKKFSLPQLVGSFYIRYKIQYTDASKLGNFWGLKISNLYKVEIQLMQLYTVYKLDFY